MVINSSLMIFSLLLIFFSEREDVVSECNVCCSFGCSAKCCVCAPIKSVETTAILDIGCESICNVFRLFDESEYTTATF